MNSLDGFSGMFSSDLTLLQLEVLSRSVTGAELGHCLVHLQTPDSEASVRAQAHRRALESLTGCSGT